MTTEEKSVITDLNKCNFSEMSEYFKAQSEARKQMSKQEKQVAFHSHSPNPQNAAECLNLIFIHFSENQGGK